MDNSQARLSRRERVEKSSDRRRWIGAAIRAALSCSLACNLLGCATGNAGSANVAGQTADPLERVTPEDLFQQGERLARAGDPIRAEQYVTSAIARGFPQAKALPLLLRVCIASSRLSAALQYATPYLKLHPSDYHLRYLVAAVQLGLGRPSEAEVELRRVLRDSPEYADAHYLLGAILRDRRDHRGAAQAFAAYQRLQPRGLHAAEVEAWLREYADPAQLASANGAIEAPAVLPGGALGVGSRSEPGPVEEPPQAAAIEAPGLEHQPAQSVGESSP